MEDGHPALMDPFENLHTLCYLFAQALCFTAKRYFTFSSSPGTLVHRAPPHHLHRAYSFLRLTCGPSQTEKALYSHGHALQKRPKGKNELQSCSPPRFVEWLSTLALALCSISFSVLAGYLLLQDMYGGTLRHPPQVRMWSYRYEDNEEPWAMVFFSTLLSSSSLHLYFSRLQRAASPLCQAGLLDQASALTHMVFGGFVGFFFWEGGSMLFIIWSLQSGLWLCLPVIGKLACRRTHCRTQFLYFGGVGLPSSMPYNIYSLNQPVSHTGYALIQRLNLLAPRCFGESSAAHIKPFSSYPSAICHNWSPVQQLGMEEVLPVASDMCYYTWKQIFLLPILYIHSNMIWCINLYTSLFLLNGVVNLLWHIYAFRLK